MTPGEVRRLYFIIRTFLSYGLDELIPKMRITLPLRLWRYSLFWMPNRHKDKPLGERLRLALQELGPVWIKFGQMLSTRRDLFPPHIADQLALLQDKVAPFDGKLAKQQIEAAMGGLPALFHYLHPRHWWLRRRKEIPDFYTQHVLSANVVSALG